MDMERRALYNLLRMNWQMDPSVAVEPWQVADYRAMSTEALFNQLEECGAQLDRVSFLALADDLDTPEDFTDHLLAEVEGDDALQQDQIYLCIFELWRRLIPEKMSLSVFCDELDHQIDLYDRDLITDPEEIQDVLANLAVILDENTDNGVDPHEVFESISNRCANDLETFLYDYIAEKIDLKNYSYAAELLDDFRVYVTDEHWFDFLKVRLTASTDTPKANLELHLLLNRIAAPELEFNLEVLSFLVQVGNQDIIKALVTQTIPLLVLEEDFQELLIICADYLHCLDDEQKEVAVQKIMKKRSQNQLKKLLKRTDPDVEELLRIITK